MSVGIFPHEQPILSAAHANRSIQVAAFELAVKRDIFSPIVAVDFTAELDKTQLYLQGTVPFMVLK